MGELGKDGARIIEMNNGNAKYTEMSSQEIKELLGLRSNSSGLIERLTPLLKAKHHAKHHRRHATRHKHHRRHNHHATRRNYHNVRVALAKGSKRRKKRKTRKKSKRKTKRNQ